MQGLIESLALPLVLVAIVLIVGGLAKKQTKQQEQPKARRTILTKNEQPTFNRLMAAHPEYIILGQVSFSALLTAKSQAARNKLNRKVADFVVCDKSFTVIAVIELDDSSHAGRARQDAERDSLLTRAGYKVLRYKTTPDLETVKRDLQRMLAPQSEAADVSSSSVLVD